MLAARRLTGFHGFPGDDLMIHTRISSSRGAALRGAAVLLALLGGAFLPLAWAGEAKKVEPPKHEGAVEKTVPESLTDLRAIQAQVKRVVEKVTPATVGVMIGGGQGSGVIISEDGYVLTAGHVALKSGANATVVMPDGRKLKAKVLGIDRKVDSGMLKITDSGKWPFVEMGKSGELKKGQWCIAVGHPGGYEDGRPPVVRLGRVLDTGKVAVRTDCTLVGGDSGGPLFDLNGKVIGIHSRISFTLTANMHVPVDLYRDGWDRLSQVDAGEPYLGVRIDLETKGCKIAEVTPGSPADLAGLKVDDLVLKFGGKAVESYEDLGIQVRNRRPNDRVEIEVRRGDQTITLQVVIGKKQE
jgi:serine protease Do